MSLSKYLGGTGTGGGGSVLSPYILISLIGVQIAVAVSEYAIHARYTQY